MTQVSIVKCQVCTEEWLKQIKECQASSISLIHW